LTKTEIIVIILLNAEVIALGRQSSEGNAMWCCLKRSRPQPGVRAEERRNFFIWIGCNPLKSPD
jgi:hypothetical protein